MEFLKFEVEGKLAKPSGNVWVNLNDVKLVRDRKDLCSTEMSSTEITELILDISGTKESIYVFAYREYLDEILRKVKADFICLTQGENPCTHIILRKEVIVEVQGKYSKNKPYAVVTTLINGKSQDHYVNESATEIMELL